MFYSKCLTKGMFILEGEGEEEEEDGEDVSFREVHFDKCSIQLKGGGIRLSLIQRISKKLFVLNKCGFLLLIWRMFA